MLPELAAAAGLTLRQTIMSELRYDTNALITPDGEQDSSDMVLQLGPDFEVTRDSEKLTLRAVYRPSFYYYFRRPELNTLSHSASAAMDYKYSVSTSFRAEDTLNYAKESLETTIIGIQNRRQAILMNTAIFSMSHRLTPRIGSGLSFSDNIVEFEDPIAVDSRNDAASISLSYQAAPATQVFTSYSFSRTEFDSPGDAIDPPLETQSVQAGFSTHYKNNLHFTLSGGVGHGSANDQNFVTASTEVSKDFEKSSVSLTYNRQSTTATGLTNQLALNETYYAAWNYALTRSVSANLFGSYARNQTLNDNSVDVRSFYYGLSGEWQLYSWLSFGAGYNHFKQNSEGLTGDDLKRDHFFVNVRITTYEKRL